MRLAHLADLHVGFRQFHRQTSAGANQRELDVARALTRAVDAVVAAAPDLVVIAGDVFHSPRPSNAAMVHVVTQCRRLTASAPVVIVAGNHDSPRAAEGGHILPLLEVVGCRVVTTDPALVRVGEAAIWCVPDTGVPQAVAYTPDATARYNIALVHGEVRGVIAGAPERPSDIDPAVWNAGWDYVALGHYHVQQQVAPRAWYAGALEYTSSNPWAEIGGPPKGWLLVDLASGVVAPQPLRDTRRFIDAPAIDATGLSAADALERVREIRETLGDLAGAVVRQRVLDCHPSAIREVRAAGRHAYGRGLLHLQWDVRKAAVEVSGALPTSTRRNLGAMLTDILTRRADASGLPLPRLLEVGQHYLTEAGDRALPSPVTP